MMGIHDVMKTPEGITGLALLWYGIDIARSDAEAWAERWAKTMPTRYTITTGPIVWIKSRLCERGMFHPFTSKAIPSPIEFACEMHCFFPFLEESEEMLSRLRTTEHVKTAEQNTARSKIGKTQLSEVTPVNAVAERVVPQ